PCTAPPRIHPSTLSLHDALPISAAGAGTGDGARQRGQPPPARRRGPAAPRRGTRPGQSRRTRLAVRLRRGTGRIMTTGIAGRVRSEEHTSELQSLAYLVCRLLLE